MKRSFCIWKRGCLSNGKFSSDGIDYVGVSFIQGLRSGFEGVYGLGPIVGREPAL